MIYGAGVDVIRFALNASINWTVTPDLLNKMKFVKSAHCSLCGYHQCTQFHILVDCPAALRQKRYTWRHDSVLNYIKKTNSPKPFDVASSAITELYQFSESW
jgi:hypothetical protein